MGTKMGPSYANLFVGYIENQFFNQFNGTKPELYGLYIDDCVGATSFSREELDHFISSVNCFHPALKYTWEISKISIDFLDIKVSMNGNGLSTSVHYTNLQIPTVICCIHPLILPTSKTLSRSLNFLDFDVYVAMIPIFPTNQRKYAISLRNMAILTLSSTRLNRLIDSQHCKRHRRKRTREFHLNSLTIHITSQPKTTF